MMKKHLPALLLLLHLFALLPVPAHAEMSLITLKHRNAESLIPLLQPVLDEGVSISGQGATLIVNSKPWQLEELRTLLAQLDTPLQSLMISVIQGGSVQRSGIQGNVSGNVAAPQVRIYGTQKNEKEAVSQRLQVIEGEWASISAGESVPVVRQSNNHSLHGTTTQPSIEYKEIESGFEVRPRLQGEQVTLEIRPFRAKRASAGGGIIEQQQITTTVSGKLGEWLTLGGVDEQQQQTGVGTVYATGKQRSATHNVKLRVERLTH